MALNIKKMLADSLLELCRTKPLQKITVIDIVNHCSLARQTFYNHFYCKEDLVIWIFHEQLRSLFEDEEVKGMTLIQQVQQHYLLFEKYDYFYKRVFNNMDTGTFLNVVEAYNREYYCMRISEMYGQDALTEKALYSIDFTAFAQAKLMYKWIMNGMPIPPDRIALYAVDNIPESLKELLQIKSV